MVAFKCHGSVLFLNVNLSGQMVIKNLSKQAVWLVIAMHLIKELGK